MGNKVLVYDPTAGDEASRVRGVGRYLQILRENFPDWTFSSFTNSQQPTTSNTVFLNPFINFTQPPLFIRKRFKRQIAVIHDLIPLKYPQNFPIGIKGKLNVFLNKIALRAYDTIITDSETSRRDIVKMLGANESIVKVVFPCLPQLFFNQQPATSNQQSSFPNYSHCAASFAEAAKTKEASRDKQLSTNNYCLYVGDATWNKNLVNLAKAIKAADATCVFVGKVFSLLHNTSEVSTSEVFRNPWQRELAEFMEMAKGDKRFVFPGFVGDEELIKLYQQSSMNILVSRDEGFGFSYVEASSQACPSLLADIPVLHETSAGHAMFCNPNDSADIAAKIKELLANQELRQRLSTEALERSKFFSRENFQDLMKKLIVFL